MKKTRTAAPRLLAWSLLLVLLCAAPVLVWAQAGFDYRLQARELAPGVFVVEGAVADFAPANGCNIINTGFIVTGAGVLVINTGPSRRYGEQLRALIARTTAQPVVRVLHLNQHPDYFLGNQAFADLPRLATPRTRAGMQREAGAYEDNLYRLCGDWMKDTAALLPSADARPGIERIGEHEIELRELSGHTDSDLLLIDRTRGVVFAGGLVFAQRLPTTPHARLPAWLASLDALAALQAPILVPSHGPVAGGLAGLSQTRRYLQWLDASFSTAARQGWEMGELLRAPLPAEFSHWGAAPAEYQRSVSHLYPAYEQSQLRPLAAPP